MIASKISFFILYILITVSCEEDKTLRYVEILFRHGDRTPTKTLPSDPIGEAAWPNGLGQLTQVGMEQTYQLGQFFRKRYGSLLNTTYVKNEVSVLSTDKDRTLMSAYCMLAGLYPPMGFQQWGKQPNFTLGHLWQPIPVPSLSYTKDPMLATDVPCPLYDQLYQERLLSSNGTDLATEYQLLSTNVPCPCYDDLFNKALSDDEGKQFQKKFKPLIDHVMKEAGWLDDPAKTLPHMWDTYDILYCMKTQHAQLPSWVNDSVYEELQTLDLYQYEYWFSTPDMQRLKAGTFLLRLLNNTNSWVNKELDPQKKVFFYSSHDSMIGAVLYALQIWNFHLPPYTCAILFEFHEVEGKRQVKVLYKNDTATNALERKPIAMEIPGCGGEFCDLDTFTSLLEPVILRNYQKECSKTKINYSVIGVVLGVVGAVLLVIIAGVAIWCHKKKKQSRNYSYRSANFSVDDQDI